MCKQAAQPLIADRVGETQIERHSDDTGAEGRTFLHAFGHRRQRRLAATAAVTGITLDLRHHRANRRQVDLVVAPVQNMVAVTQRGTAVATGGRLGRHQLVGIGRQWTATADAPQAALARAVPLDLGRTIRLVSLR